MFGNNPIRKIETGDGELLSVQNIFPTFQGEGPMVGFPAVFLRLGGCNLACRFCDTEFESFKTMSCKDILAQIKRFALNEVTNQRTRNLVVITGGEPFRQPIERICNELINIGFTVQIETNGTLFRNIHSQVKIICSPKNNGNGYHRIRDDLAARVEAYKFIISKNNPLYDHVAEIGQSKYKTPVYIQPMDEYDIDKNLQNVKFAVQLADKIGARISIQLHKLLEIE
jgi:7-carboxy-7-deazaguanine synthase